MIIIFMLDTFEINDGQKGESSLFSLLTGSSKSEEPPLLEALAQRLLDKKTYNMEIYGDRIVGISPNKNIILYLDGDVMFKRNQQAPQICLKSDENGKEEILSFSNSICLEQFSSVLKRVCPQSGFFQNYILDQKLGKGKNSQVFKVVRKSDNQLFACKIQQNSSSFMREISTLRQLEHPNVIYFREYFIEADQMTYTIMDYENGGNLLSILQQEEQISLKKKIQIISDLLNAMEFLRVKGIVHRDIKPENILFSQKDGKYKIADFGFARKAQQKFDKIVGTPGYIAPQVIQEKAEYITIESDIYSMGLVFFEILTKRQYYKGETSQQILKKNIKAKSFKKRATQFTFRSFERELLDKMIRTSPQNRKDSMQILSSSTFKKMNKIHQSESRESGSTQSKDSDDDQSLMDTVKKLFKYRTSS